MRIIFIRHAEPDYSFDGLTPNGEKEAKALGNRIAKWNVDKFYVSPMGRAQATIAPALSILNREAITIPWLREYSYRVEKAHGKAGVCWDFIPSDWANNPTMFTTNDWLNIEPFCQNQEIRDVYFASKNGLDEIIAEYGYIRKGNYFINTKSPKMKQINSTCVDPRTHYGDTLPDSDNGPTIVMVCHFGIICLMLSHLLNIPFPALAQGTIIPPTGVTVVTSEERWDDEAFFRISQFGDVTHLREASLPISSAGSFYHVFQD